MSVSTDSDFKWTAKGDWQTVTYRNLLCDHIEQGGTGDDQVGSEIIKKYIGALMLASDFRELAAHYRFNTADLHNVISMVISAGLEGELPSPFIQDGIPKLLACVLVEKKAAITAIMQRVNQTEASHVEEAKELHPNVTEPRDRAIFGRINAIAEATVEVGRQHYDFITKMNGPASATINPNGKGLPTSNVPGGGCGCAPLLILGGLTLSGGGLCALMANALIESSTR